MGFRSVPTSREPGPVACRCRPTSRCNGRLTRCLVWLLQPCASSQTPLNSGVRAHWKDFRQSLRVLTSVRFLVETLAGGRRQATPATGPRPLPHSWPPLSRVALQSPSASNVRCLFRWGRMSRDLRRRGLERAVGPGVLVLVVGRSPQALCRLHGFSARFATQFTPACRRSYAGTILPLHDEVF